MSNFKLLRLDEGRTFCLNFEVDIPYGGEDHSEKEILTYISDAWIERTLHNTFNNPCIHSIFVYGKKIVKKTITDQYRGPKKFLGNGLHLGGDVFTKYLLSVEVEVTISYVTENEKWNPNLYKQWGDESDELDYSLMLFLNKHEIDYYWQVVSKTRDELLKMRYCWPSTIEKLRTILERDRLHLGMNLKGFNPNKKEIKR